MDKIVIHGGKKLVGEVMNSGSKNASLPIMAAALLSAEPSRIENVPDLRDVHTMVKLLRVLGAQVDYTNGVVEVYPGNAIKSNAPYDIVSTMRASVCVLGPLLTRLKEADVSIPGGCVIGARPIDLHIKGLEMLGADILIDHGFVKAKAPKGLRGADVYLGGNFGSSVLATANVLMAATLAKGTTYIEGAACEPELVDLAEFLIKMGAKIKGHGSHLIEIQGVKKLHGANHRVIPDRIEAGTFMVAGAMMNGNDILVRNCIIDHNHALIDKLKQSGALVLKSKSSIRLKRRGRLRPVDVTTLPYPGFPTDLQAQMMALMTLTPGISVITEKIYPDRFIHISELTRMGAKIFLEGSTAIVSGVGHLSGAPVMASDLRASAALLLAGLAAEGETEVNRIYHLDRGYEKIEEKLSALGAEIFRKKEESQKELAAVAL
ncbi:MAG: UDP-N-acetylglucosamine 1-carboxyvinyltransferase [Omnitrophica bacterium RIFCSPLOWO2_12_FULL_44_17]|uniref:UDP-N-acetylglucosamine 1-carboxyvinyltransferase n=1 Tax=Candidatus Danuiimicrobium aquiferis TaxID=1801832 RepID=A0A1G1KX67_9BACT|nr:MAG: UDP-N-acetylglucosamine 1-carboxyvinyltransferase [Omnitrophica bacterium RIFCSPHIGHO2_02_FULL_45_28]OGW91052.1 MAG: UDP-N-acetylglucosamine 1-carboxyvinyltransferase [Omnitrophica bacterium RIFCSPHIGHO2_12_FULL_44_12]OGW97402.1 MAG: UDP-N-acetylglucosamine 1-carboxyvinyltransferase [Omnitrophica bacterium RIFCSPLOWO2_12_FULL_44_17]OGX04476.1 MAG: UDP-N-acetylglucosamine 1-carboxyvinyltransferase [Omnitrophica bacterium RIFCSPLOWO2_02_FULL_44_11]